MQDLSEEEATPYLQPMDTRDTEMKKRGMRKILTDNPIKEK